MAKRNNAAYRAGRLASFVLGVVARQPRGPSAAGGAKRPPTQQPTAKVTKTAAKTKWASDAERTAALLLMANGRTYSAGGQIRQQEFRERGGYTNNGPIAKWNMKAKTEFGGAKEAIAAAKQWIDTHAGRQADAIDKLAHRYDVRAQANRRLSATEEAQMARFRAGDLSMPQHAARQPGETPAQTLARVTRDREAMNAWLDSAGNRASFEPRKLVGYNSWGKTPRSPGYHIYHREGQREEAAKNRLRRTQNAAYRSGPAKKIGAAAEKELRAAAKSGAVVPLQGLRDRLIARYSPSMATYYQSGKMDYARASALSKLGWADDKHHAIQQELAGAVARVAYNHDITAYKTDYNGHVSGMRGRLTSTEADVRRPRQADNRMLGLKLEGASDNPKQPQYVDAEGKPTSSYDREKGSVEFGDITGLQIGNAWSADTAAKATASVDAQRREANPIYNALASGKTVVVRRSENRSVPDARYHGYANKTVSRDVNVTIKPLGFDGTHWTVQETIPGKSAPVEAKYTPEQLDYLAGADSANRSWRSWTLKSIK